VLFRSGDDTGLAHSWTDTNVVNGKTYYYGVVSYDAGDPNLGDGGLPPSQSTAIIEKDAFGNFTADVNTAIVTPAAPSAGYSGATIENSATHTNGNGSGEVKVSILFPEEISENKNYQITFRDTILRENDVNLFQTYSYNVRDLSSGNTIVSNSRAIGSSDIYPVFDGMGIEADNMEINFLSSTSGLKSGQSDFAISVVPDTANTGPTAGLGGLFPYDYNITFASTIVDTSVGSDLGLDEIPVNFTVENIESGELVRFIFLDKDDTKTVTDGDEVIPLIDLDPTLSALGYGTTWRIGFTGGTTAPQAGDQFEILFSNPFGNDDVFEFKTLQSAGIDNAKGKKDIDKITVVPNPYVLTNILEPRNISNSGRGERVITFTNLPQICTIRIFNLRGHLVDIINHNGSQTNGVEKWNLTSKDGIDIAFGIYIYHVDAKGLGKKIGRFAVIK